ncbi:MAG TPA: CpXC domain-containing protein [Kofleriaceae bacterium]|nr:CpXC domain-containing protein [Kofleriaceae bacterium]
MSVTETFLIDCDCGARVEALCCLTINADRHPHLREALLDRTLHQFQCGACGKTLSVEKKLAYIDLARRQFYSTAPERERAAERALAEDVIAAWNLAFGTQAPVSVGALFDTEKFQVRLCFGLEELREKVVAQEARLEDLALEVLKAELMGAHPDWGERGIRTLRLDHVEPDGRLAFLLERATEPPAVADVGLLVERARHDRLAERPWRELVDGFPGIASGPYVSVLRLAPPPPPLPT